MDYNEVKDWKGNVLKKGDEFCIIRVKRNSIFKKFSIIVPIGENQFNQIELPEEKEEDCWEVGEYTEVLGSNNKLYFVSKENGYTINTPLSTINLFIDKEHILAIKGVSDFKPMIILND